jgi:hypothetical protein
MICALYAFFGFNYHIGFNKLNTKILSYCQTPKQMNLSLRLNIWFHIRWLPISHSISAGGFLCFSVPITKFYTLDASYKYLHLSSNHLNTSFCQSEYFACGTDREPSIFFKKGMILGLFAKLRRAIYSLSCLYICSSVCLSVHKKQFGSNERVFTQFHIWRFVGNVGKK